MKLALIGFGQAGGKIVDKFLSYDQQTGSNIVRSAVAVNTAKADLIGLKNVPNENRVLIGQSRVKGHGVGADNELGAEIAEEDIDEMQGTIDNVPVHEIDAFLIVAALGGGTGSGGAPVLAKHLKRIYTEPVYGLGILPAADEGGIYTLNAARSFQTFVRETDNLLVFDNDAWRQSGQSLSAGYGEINREIVRRFGLLFSAGELSAVEEVGESVVDASEIINTLATGGISTVGYSTGDLPASDARRRSLLGRFAANGHREVDEAEAVSRIQSTVRQATLGRLTLPCEVASTERALVVVAGPPDHLSRKGIERAREWLEDEAATLEVRGGDFPQPSATRVASVVLLSGVSNVPRITELQQVAIEAQDNIRRLDEEHEDALDALVQDDEGELDPLF